MTLADVFDNTTLPQSSARGRTWADRGFEAIEEANRVRWWYPRDPGYVTRNKLLLFAQRRIAHLMNIPPNWDDEGGVPVTPLAAKLALKVLFHLITADNLATPQISPTGAGGVDIEWLVSGNHLSLSVAPDSNIVMWATKRDGTEVFSFDSTDNPACLGYKLKEADDFLSEISSGVRNRLAILSEARRR
jgi:hypothetical protein